MQEIKINTEFIKLDAFLKWSGIATMGSEAKFYIQNGEVKVNGEIEDRRGRKLIYGDIVEFQDEIYKII
ncbi:S4 domain-containing protein YaaA [Clostridium botulinum]|uniref:RNA-binding protein n=1 Tax=Clostridium botulinum TaxID=1491 RepID=A0A9Q1ZD77_CLOBO|nr:S4 domain-containing protein YaaA [Clostridium botulinum]AEB77199.1 S4 domain protein [Clostridium botulinum BKT015925]KEI01710.1 RNA-binding protein [Clostridium botulinum C/D str. Sp77]KEI02715.1 RNA-binding protein [Clostridium botulinum D str. 16868]KLU74920.1 RNA-binding protein [Clostridium botulinum V891]KOA77089.1 RNA-binding protein [Clostridium botulinum]